MNCSGSKEVSSASRDRVVIILEQPNPAESASDLDRKSRDFVQEMSHPIHIIIRSTGSYVARHEKRTTKNLVSPYPSRAKLHGDYTSRTMLHGRGDASKVGMEKDSDKRFNFGTSRPTTSQAATSDSGLWTEKLKKDYKKHLLQREMERRSYYNEKLQASESVLKSQLQAEYRNHSIQLQLEQEACIAVLRDQVKDLIKSSESQGEYNRMTSGQGTRSANDQRPRDSTIQNEIHTGGNTTANESNASENGLTYDGPDYLGDMNSNSSMTSNPNNSSGIFVGMSPNGNFSHPKSPSATPTRAQFTTCDTAAREGVDIKQMPISAPGPSDGRYIGQSYSSVPISLNASAMSNQISYHGNAQCHQYYRPYGYHPAAGMYHDNYQYMTGRPYYSALIQNTSNPNAISNFNQNHQTVRLPRFVDVLTSSSGARPTTQSAGAPSGTPADTQSDAGAAGQISRAQTLPVFNIRTRNGGTTGVPAYTGGTSRVPAYTGREGTASPNGSASSFTISYSDHSSYHGSSYQSSLLGHDDSVGGSDVDSLSQSSDLGELTNSDHEVALTGQDNILTDPPQDDMMLFDIWAFANLRIMNLKDSSPRLGAGYAFRWGGDMITETDMRVIGGIGGFYDDNYINCIITVIKHCNIYNEATSDSIHFVDPLYGQLITTSNTRTRHTAPMGLVRSIANALSKGKTDILMPVNVDENHWMSTISEFADFEEVIITGIEVLMADRTYLLERIRNFYVKNWKTLRPGRRLPKITMRMMMPPESPLMTDGSSCGPFMCIMMDLYCRGIPMREFRRYVNQNNIVEARRRIAAFLNGFCCTGRRALAAASRA